MWIISSAPVAPPLRLGTPHPQRVLVLCMLSWGTILIIQPSRLTMQRFKERRSGSVSDGQTNQYIVVHFPVIETGGVESESQQTTPKKVDQKDPQADEAKLGMG
ncbi:hypothetical protein N7536_004051 [Penicillium majusculum]|nr:hypothetical protein N7536_004051 [Penicillium majusculum]